MSSPDKKAATDSSSMWTLAESAPRVVWAAATTMTSAGRQRLLGDDIALRVGRAMLAAISDRGEDEYVQICYVLEHRRARGQRPGAGAVQCSGQVCAEHCFGERLGREQGKNEENKKQGLALVGPNGA